MNEDREVYLDEEGFHDINRRLETNMPLLDRQRVLTSMKERTWKKT